MKGLRCWLWDSCVATTL